MGLAVLDKELRYVRINNRLAKINGIPSQEHIGKRIRDVVPDIADEAEKAISQIFLTGKPILNMEFTATTAAHPTEKRTYLENWIPIKNEIGKITLLYAMVEDITERKKAEEALFEARRRAEQNSRNLFTIFESLPLAVTMLEKINREFIYANSNAKELFGFDVVRLNFSQYVDRVKPKRLDGSPYPTEKIPLSRALNGEKVFDEDVIIEREDGKSLFVSNSAVPLVNAEGVVFSAVAVFIDITERIKAEKVLTEAQAKLQEYANDLECLVEKRTKKLRDSERMAAIGQTAGMVGHDIRNPLQAVMSETYLLKEELTSPDGQKKEAVTESLESIETNVAYINKIVQDLQDFARPVKPEYSVVDLSNILVSIFKIVRVPDSIKLSIRVNDLEKLRTDPMLLQRALSNLVTNAIQAMPQGGTLEITGHQERNIVIITVSDTGVGIPAEIKPKLFTPMMTTKSKGQGFGLAVSKRLIEVMKGTISFESEEGKGTKFIIELPMTSSH